MSSQTAASELSRDELVERVEQLEQRIEQLEQNTITPTQLNHVVDALTNGEVEDFRSDPVEFLDAIAEIGNQIADMQSTVSQHDSAIEELESSASNASTDHWENVVELAQNVADKPTNQLPNDWVAIYTDDVAAATGLSQRRSQQLIDQWGGRMGGESAKDGTRYQEYQPGSESTQGAVQKKALKIDLDVWGER